MIEQLCSKVFTTRNLAHLAHLQTRSYAKHIALGDFYGEIIESVDEIIEVWQGNYGLMKKVKLPEDMAPTDQEILDHLKQEAGWIAQNREQISQGCQAVNNLIDGLVGIYLRAIYKLTNLG